MPLVVKLIDFILESSIFYFFWGAGGKQFISLRILVWYLKTAWKQPHHQFHSGWIFMTNPTGDRRPGCQGQMNADLTQPTFWSSLHILSASPHVHIQFQDLKTHKLDFPRSLVYHIRVWADAEQWHWCCYFCHCLSLSNEPLLSHWSLFVCLWKRGNNSTEQEGHKCKYKTNAKMHEPTLPMGVLLSINMTAQGLSLIIAWNIIHRGSRQALMDTMPGISGVLIRWPDPLHRPRHKCIVIAAHLHWWK